MAVLAVLVIGPVVVVLSGLSDPGRQGGDLDWFGFGAEDVPACTDVPSPSTVPTRSSLP